MSNIEHGQVAFGTSTIDYRVERSTRRKTVTVAIDPVDGVILKAPVDVPEQRLDAVVTSKGAWILQRLLDYRELGPAPPPREYVGGESYLYLGRSYRLKVVSSADVREPRAALRGAFLTVEISEDDADEGRADVVRDALVSWYRRRAARRLPERVALYAARAGLECPPVLIRNQEKRWGSCSSKGEVRFNWRIIMGPMSLVDYVVAHEVCHLQVRDHSSAFWRLLGAVLPDYEERRTRLRVEGLWYRV
ncbi:MAG: SprT family zinc-dependent metalloprotease [Sandaracinaceae bacterium]